jgi:hypothetical protein
MRSLIIVILIAAVLCQTRNVPKYFTAYIEFTKNETHEIKQVINKITPTKTSGYDIDGGSCFRVSTENTDFTLARVYPVSLFDKQPAPHFEGTEQIRDIKCNKYSTKVGENTLIGWFADLFSGFAGTKCGYTFPVRTMFYSSPGSPYTFYWSAFYMYIETNCSWAKKLNLEL